MGGEHSLSRVSIGSQVSIFEGNFAQDVESEDAADTEVLKDHEVDATPVDIISPTVVSVMASDIFLVNKSKSLISLITTFHLIC